jgi:hypothetical protein
MTVNYMCPVCGYPELTEPPRVAGSGGSYEICPSCGFEFGYTDDDLGFSYDTWRAKWIAEGMRWDPSDVEPAPDGWDPIEQLRNLPTDV